MMDQTLSASGYRIFGDSHVIMLRQAAGQLISQIKAAGWPLITVRRFSAANELYKPFYERQGDRIILTNPIMRKNAIDLCNIQGNLFPPGDTLSFVSLGMHTQTFLTGYRWSTHSHWRTEAARTRHALSDAAFEAMVLDINRYILAFLTDMAEVGHRIAILSAPPPTRRFKLLEVGFSESDVLFLDSRVREVMKAEFARRGLAVIDPPDGVTDGAFLREEFLMPDPSDTHHGNVEYSIRLLRKLATVCGKPF